MVGGLDLAAIHVDITDVFIGSCVAEEDTSKIMLIQLGALLASPFHTDLRSKDTELAEIWLSTIPGFKRSHHDAFVYPPIVKKDGM
jgi:hypothetical protein